MRKFLFVIVLLFQGNIYAQTWKDYLPLFKDYTGDTRLGPVCEYLARKDLEKKYHPNQYEILSGIGYFHASLRERFEIDLMIRNRQTNKFKAIGEVKCRTSRRSLKYAHLQLLRFKTHLEALKRGQNRGASRVSLWIDRETTLWVDWKDFHEAQYWKIVPKGTQGVYAPYSLPLPLSDLQMLSDNLRTLRKPAALALAQLEQAAGTL